MKVALFGGASTPPEAEEGVKAEEGDRAEFLDGVRFTGEEFEVEEEEEDDDDEEEGVVVEDSCWRYSLVIRSERLLCAVSNFPTTYTDHVEQYVLQKLLQNAHHTYAEHGRAQQNKGTRKSRYGIGYDNIYIKQLSHQSASLPLPLSLPCLLEPP